MKYAAFASVAVLILAAGARAQEVIDCALLKTTSVPFAINYEVRRAYIDPSVRPTVTKEQTQILRKQSETIALTESAPGRYIRVRSVYPLLPTESYVSQPPTSRSWTYSIDPTIDYVARRAPLDFTAAQRDADGSTYLSARVTIKFIGTVTADVQGCSFDLVKVERRMEGTIGGKPFSGYAEIWISSELRASFYTRVTDGKNAFTYSPVGITLNFRPLE